MNAQPNTSEPTESSLAVTADQPVIPAHLNQSLVQEQSTELALIKQKAQLLVDSGMMPKSIDRWQKAAVIMIKGRELAIPDMVALQHISVVHGNPQIDGQLTLALLERSGLMENFAIKEMTDQVCTVHVKRRGRIAMDYTCKLEHAAGLRMKEGEEWKSLIDTQQWTMQRRTKLFYFTVKEMARRLFSDVLNGMASNQQGEVLITGDFEDADFYEEEVASEGASAPPLSPSPSATPADSSAGDALVEDVEEAEYAPDEPVTIGTLDMISLLNRATRAGLVKHPKHMDNLVRKLKADGSIRDAMTAAQVLDAMRKHKAANEMDGEPTGVTE